MTRGLTAVVGARVALAGVSAGFGPGPLCPTNKPLPASVAENEEFYAVRCGLGWNGGGSILPCPAPSSPVVTTTFAQAVVLEAQVPVFMTEAIAARWIAEQVLDDGGVIILWEQRVELNAHALEGATVSFRAPGLKQSTTHRYRVAFDAPDGTLTCWSPVSSGATGGLLGGPAPPADTALRLEDEFVGPATSFLAGGGAGIGPVEVYRSQHQVQIDADGNSVRLSDSENAPTIGAYAVHATPEPNEHVFVDVRFMNAFPTNQQYRVDAIARAKPGAIGYKYYFAQVYDEPPLSGFRVGYRDLSDSANALGVTIGSPTPCSPGFPFWVRLEVDGTFPPVLKGTVTWDGAGSPCTVTGTDTQNRLREPGFVGFSGHHREYLVDRFLAGWAP